MHERDRLAHVRGSTGPMGSEYLQVFHNHSQVFKPAHGSGPDALAQEIINNVTNIYFSAPLMYLGFPSPLDSGLVTTLDLMGNKGTVCISKVHGGTGTNVTKQWSKVHHSDGITKLSMA